MDFKSKVIFYPRAAWFGYYLHKFMFTFKIIPNGKRLRRNGVENFNFPSSRTENIFAVR